MKNLILISIFYCLSINAIDLSRSPVGLDTFLNEIQTADFLYEHQGNEYVLTSPFGFSDSDLNLEVLPLDNFETIKISNKKWKVTLIEPDGLYEESFFGSYLELVQDKVQFKWSDSGVVNPDDSTGSTSSCEVVIGFTRNNRVIDFNYFDESEYHFEYDKSVFKDVFFDGNSVKVVRRTNKRSTIKAIINRGGLNPVIITNTDAPFCSNASQDVVLDGSWSHWSSWSTCNATCDNPYGTQSRMRTCSNPAPVNGGRYCSGTDTQTRTCEMRSCTRQDPSLTEDQKAFMQNKAVSIDIEDTHSRGFASSRFTADYSASISNPFERTLRCNLELRSSRGKNRSFEVVDKKTHFSIVIRPKSISYVQGQIECRKGRGDNGLLWTNNPGHSYKATGCTFID